MKLVIKENYFRLFPRMSKGEMDKLVKSIEKNGQFVPIAVNNKGIVLDGHSRIEACKILKIEPHYNVFTFKTEEEELDFVVASNLVRRHLSDIQKYELAKKLLPMEAEFAKKRQLAGIKVTEEREEEKGTTFHKIGRDIGISEAKLKRIKAIDEAGRTDLLDAIETGQTTVYGAYGKILPKKLLKDDYVVPPFSILDLRTKEAMNSKAIYHNRFDSGLGRNQKALGMTGIVAVGMLYSGGSVRGIMAGELGREYVGFDLREEQIDENEEQALKVDWNLDGNKKPRWVVCDSIDLDKHLSPEFEADLIFTSPPYSLGLEHYSDKPEDLNNLSLEDFKEKYAEIIRKGLQYLKKDGYSVWVVSDARKKNGFYWGLDTYTTKIHEEEGWGLLNTQIELDPLGTAPQRARSLFDGSKKLVRIHQVILTYAWEGK
jgi:hypothetical protein